MTQTDIYLFAHQDDEFGVYQTIETGAEAGRRPICIFLTDGAGGGASPDARNKESLKVLTQLGVAPGDIHFIGSEQGIPDGGLVDELPRARELTFQILDTLSGPISFTGHAWEGGHPDHDAAHLLMLWCAKDLNLPLDAVRCFALYNAKDMPGPFFRVLAPITSHGAVTRETIPWADRLRHLRLYLTYRTQWRTLVGLYPIILLHYLTSGAQTLQHPATERPSGRPHAGPLLYEKRQGRRYEDFLQALPQGMPVRPAP
jgi:LmbE family N-acetylglucosaminyl deacetylase